MNMILASEAIVPAGLVAVLLRVLVIGLVIGLIAWLVQAIPIPSPLKEILYWFVMAVGVIIIVLLLLSLL